MTSISCAYVRGTRGHKGERVRVIYDLVDTRDFSTGFTSMQRTVGFTLARGARLILGGEWVSAGFSRRSTFHMRACFRLLERHGIHVERRELRWPS